MIQKAVLFFVFFVVVVVVVVLGQLKLVIKQSIYLILPSETQAVTCSPQMEEGVSRGGRTLLRYYHLLFLQNIATFDQIPHQKNTKEPRQRLERFFFSSMNGKHCIQGFFQGKIIHCLCLTLHNYNSSFLRKIL